MNRKRNLWIFISIVIFAAALVSGFILMQPSAADILVQTLETAKTITDGHAVVAIDLDMAEKDSNGMIEIWAVRGEKSDDGDHHFGAFRIEVLETSHENAQGAVIVSDGETLWAYSPVENKVFVGTPEDAQAMMADNDFMDGEFGDFHEGDHLDGWEHKDSEHAHPESTEEAVAKLLEYFNVSKNGSQVLAGETANQLKMMPIPDQMPEEYIAIGGYLDLWIGQESSLPLSIAYTGGTMGELQATVLEFEVNTGLDESLFTFEIPAGAEVVTLEDLEPQSLTLDEAGATTEFDFQTPTETPDGATLVDIQEVSGAIVQRYTLPEGGSFTVAQSLVNENSDQLGSRSAEGQPIEVRGTNGTIRISEDGSQVLLTWIEGDLIYLVAGDLTAENAMLVAESLQ
jgi:hypothetical protein